MTTADHRLGPGIGPATITAVELRRRFGIGPEFGELLRSGQRVRADRGVLIVLQAVNAGGKDGTIAEVESALAPTRFRVERFRRRSPATTVQHVLAHALAASPAQGELVFFHRSYYEELLLAVLENHSDAERILADTARLEEQFSSRSTVVLKLFLHIDRDEQLRRLNARREQPDLAHLHNPEDYRDQARWDALMGAYETVLNRSHSESHPWLVVPANNRAVRNAIVASVLRPHLEP